MCHPVAPQLDVHCTGAANRERERERGVHNVYILGLQMQMNA